MCIINSYIICVLQGKRKFQSKSDLELGGKRVACGVQKLGPFTISIPLPDCSYESVLEYIFHKDLDAKYVISKKIPNLVCVVNDNFSVWYLWLILYRGTYIFYWLSVDLIFDFIVSILSIQTSTILTDNKFQLCLLQLCYLAR